ncbi:flagellar basal-body MS-ring/collar protein FliF [Palleronia abyssalis]|uniref:Flagellar M-ring protein n=1 Tax=Palleronia abyssalis TaxID=1501240 RepID=A0A2R8BWW7_9RHOB|nr:flagellar basal-body MS-ring/collar protein FliF [Palleronia abyssalis]SPJ24654.1 Flagellar M-ring protein [Palleronia abyssalis]
MQELISVWQALSLQRRIVVIGATVAMFALVLGVARMASRPEMSLLYSGLEPGAAGEVVQALEQRGVVYDVRAGAIFVEDSQRDGLRMTLASEGLPADSSAGYELLDQMSGFGTTSQMFDAAYWRAKEGELARTIVASPSVQAARVHIANTGTKPFQRDVTPTASVTITPAGGGISTSHAKALRFLVASAVAGLSPEQVSIIDGNGGVILGGEDTPQGGQGQSKAEQLKRNVERLLEARVGYGNVVVEVNVETVNETEQIVERRIDPESRVAISQDIQQSKESSSDAGGGNVTVASNLPGGDAETDGPTASSQMSESRETVNYEVSQIERQVTRAPGSVSRITTAVLIDGVTQTAEDGTVEWSPRPETEIAALRELVAATIGFNEDRGDTLSVQSMRFEPLPSEGTAPGSGAFTGPIDVMRLAQLAILALAAIALGLFVVRPILAKGSAATALPAPDTDTEEDGEVLSGEVFFGDGMPMMGDGGGFFVGDDEPSEPTAVERLRQLIDERQEESLEILKSWMEDDGEKA